MPPSRSNDGSAPEPGTGRPLRGHRRQAQRAGAERRLGPGRGARADPFRARRRRVVVYRHLGLFGRQQLFASVDAGWRRHSGGLRHLSRPATGNDAPEPRRRHSLRQLPPRHGHPGRDDRRRRRPACQRRRRCLWPSARRRLGDTNGARLRRQFGPRGYTASSVNPTTHVNGVKDVIPAGGTYANGTCNTGCHGGQ